MSSPCKNNKQVELRSAESRNLFESYLFEEKQTVRESDCPFRLWQMWFAQLIPMSNESVFAWLLNISEAFKMNCSDVKWTHYQSDFTSQEKTIRGIITLDSHLIQTKFQVKKSDRSQQNYLDRGFNSAGCSLGNPRIRVCAEVDELLLLTVVWPCCSWFDFGW